MKMFRLYHTKRLQNKGLSYRQRAFLCDKERPVVNGLPYLLTHLRLLSCINYLSQNSCFRFLKKLFDVAILSFSVKIVCIMSKTKSKTMKSTKEYSIQIRTVAKYQEKVYLIK